jgi:hypothetical protein
LNSNVKGTIRVNIAHMSKGGKSGSFTTGIEEYYAITVRSRYSSGCEVADYGMEDQYSYQKLSSCSFSFGGGEGGVQNWPSIFIYVQFRH